MSKQENDKPAEIVIVRRKRGNGDDCHHGGVWKVAYADFMTAMMAFFLVMWLINAANEETRSQVASYFNPVKLVDTTTNPRGLKDNKDSSSGDVENKELKSEALARSDEGEGHADDNKKLRQERKKGPATHFSGGDIPESELFRDPLRTLDKIAGGAPDLLKGSAQPQRRPDLLGAEGGEQFRDPFSPRSWDSLEKVLPDDQVNNPSEGGPDLASERAGGRNRDKKRQQPVPDANKAQKSRRMAKNRQQVKEKTPPRDDRLAGHGKTRDRQPGLAKSASKDRKQKAEEVYREIKEALRKELSGGNAAHMPNVSVKRTPEGILISLTDKAGFGMFEIGSAKPRRETVKFMEKIARILRDKPGRIVVRGHTDGRPFRNDVYDNWRLSTARAHSARYMLLRGGIQEGRISRVEGYADRRLASPKDPFAARNRRIEILLVEK